MQSVEELDVDGAHLAVRWLDASREPAEGRASADYAADFGAALASRLAVEGYRARRIDIALRRGRLGVLELLVRGEVAGIDEAEFVTLARSTLNTPVAWQHVPSEPSILWARLTPLGNGTPASASEPAARGSPAQPAEPGLRTTRQALDTRAPEPVPVAADDAPASRPRPIRDAGGAVSASRPGLGRGAALPSVSARPSAPVAGGVRFRDARVFGRTVPWGKLTVGLLAGCALGVLGLPRLETVLPGQQQAPGAPSSELATGQSAPTPTLVPALAALPVQPDQSAQPLQPVEPEQPAQPVEAQGSAQAIPPASPIPPVQPASPARLASPAQPARPASPAQPIQSVSPAQAIPPAQPAAGAQTAVLSTPPPSQAPPLFAERFVSPLPNWPNDPNGAAWFADGVYRLSTRQPGRFVTVGVPLAVPVGDATIYARFHKVSGPDGGGYGIIIRDQGTAPASDPDGQPGEFIVLEVGDRGEVGMWQRAETGWIDIVGWTHSDAVRRASEPNALAITIRGASIRFEVNNEVVANVIYNGLPTTGGVGVFVGGDRNDIALESLRIDTLHT